MRLNDRGQSPAVWFMLLPNNCFLRLMAPLSASYGGSAAASSSPLIFMMADKSSLSLPEEMKKELSSHGSSSSC